MSKRVRNIVWELQRERDMNAKVDSMDQHVFGTSTNIRKPLVRAAAKTNVEVGR